MRKRERGGRRIKVPLPVALCTVIKGEEGDSEKEKKEWEIRREKIWLFHVYKRKHFIFDSVVVF